ncbi:hypothetical protein PVK06_045436 [Gossypium arboreum]|uniref:Uncharacterized protein n=1 Tax=Gossypium arboreum TaxID=29729 RepID=A0ABR0MWL4_GOSAR|nr:hypothetical protein PVK06_045436 [Gossypium arboreum]
MKILNLIREFELQKMNDSETVEEYFDKLLVQKILLTVPEKIEVIISSLENTKDMLKEQNLQQTLWKKGSSTFQMLEKVRQTI